MKEIALSEPNAGISSLHFNPLRSKLLELSTWTGNLYQHDLVEGQVTCLLSADSPILCSTWVDEQNIIIGTGDGHIQTTEGQIIKAHNSGVSFISCFQGLCVSTSWDHTVKLWRIDNMEMQHELDLHDRILCAGLYEYQCVAYTANGYVFNIDIRNPEFNIDRRVSSLSNQVRSLCVTDFGWAIGSIDGRIAIDYFGDCMRQAQRFAFSANKRSEEENIIVYPVNTLSFNPITHILVSGSSNGDICYWNIDAKRKTGQIISPFSLSVAAVDHNKDGLLAIAYSYTWDKGDIPHPPDHLVLQQ